MAPIRLGVAVALAAILTIFLVQNMAPAVALTFLGSSTVRLSLAVWLLGAIALGSLSAIALSLLSGGSSGAQPSSRRQWRVQPPPDRAERPPRSANPRREPPPHKGSDPRPARSQEDWQAWEAQQRGDRWEDWTSATEANPRPGPPRREPPRDSRGEGYAPPRPRPEPPRPEPPRGGIPFPNLAEEWAARRANGPEKPPTREVDEALDDIVSGWGDWGDRPPGLVDEPTATSYAYSYGKDSPPRQDAVYAPPDDQQDQPDHDDWVDGESDSEDPEDAEGVYDADYRVIIPPYRGSADNEGDRPDPSP